MADYSMVKDQNDNVCGLWIRNEAEARDSKMLCMLLAKHGLAKSLLTAALSGDYRVVPNKVDSNGGSFVMFGSAPAPGE